MDLATMRLSMKFHIKDLNAQEAEIQEGSMAWAKENVQSMQSSTLFIRRPGRVSAGKGPLHSLLTREVTSSCGQSFNNRRVVPETPAAKDLVEGSLYLEAWRAS